MKKFIANNWTKLLRIGGYITLIIIALYKINAPKTLIPDYIKYGKEIQPAGISGESTGIIGSFFGKAFASFDAIDPALTTFVIIITVAILAIVTLHMLIDKKPDAKKKK